MKAYCDRPSVTLIITTPENKEEHKLYLPFYAKSNGYLYKIGHNKKKVIRVCNNPVSLKVIEFENEGELFVEFNYLELEKFIDKQEELYLEFTKISDVIIEKAGLWSF